MGEGEGEGEVFVAVLDDRGMKNENSSRIESKRDHEWLGDDTEVEPCTMKQTKEASSDTELESCANKYELESSCTKKHANDALSDTELESCANKHELESSCMKKQAKDSLSDTELESANSENSSTCSGNSSSEESLNEEEESENDTSEAVSTSLFVCEIPKYFSSTGIRKITFKFSKRKEDYDNQLSATAVGSGSDGISQWNHSASDDMNTKISSCGKVVDESSKAFLCQPNMELKMSKKVLPDSYPTTVKKLLSTGILEGARVKYVTTSQERELPGIIKGCGYLCGCSLCNFSKYVAILLMHGCGDLNRVRDYGQASTILVSCETEKTTEGRTKKRDNDLHRLLFMLNGLLDGAELAYYSKGQRILGGYKQGNGIVCRCCHTKISPSQFEALAGWSTRRQPDDTCAACGAGGDLIICDECPRAFHAATQYSFSHFVQELSRDKWFCCDDYNRIHVALQNLVLVGAEMIPASVSYAIHRKHVKKGFTDGVSNDVQWRILSGKSHYPKHLPVLSRAAECFDPIVATSGLDLIPVMVYGRHIFGQEFGGMHCVVLIVKSVIVSAGLLRIFGREVAELRLVATSRENQGKLLKYTRNL
ncbi:hypothetical protein ACSBR2_035513 [Camellia fascicularis]